LRRRLQRLTKSGFSNGAGREGYRSIARRTQMEFRRLGKSGLTVPALSFGTGTFGGVGRLAAWGSTDATEARRLVDICLDAGVSMFDTADIYSLGESERVL